MTKEIPGDLGSEVRKTVEEEVLRQAMDKKAAAESKLVPEPGMSASEFANQRFDAQVELTDAQVAASRARQRIKDLDSQTSSKPEPTPRPEQVDTDHPKAA